MLAYKLSYWERETFFKDIDVAVIGSGIVGLTAALHLKTLNPKLQITILERGGLPTGASTRNAGFACFGSPSELLEDAANYGEDTMLAVVEKRWRGLQGLRALIGDTNMDFQAHGGYEMFTDQEESTYRECADQLPYLNTKIGAITGQSAIYKNTDEHLSHFGFQGIRHLILNQAEGQVHTGKMMAALLALAENKGIKIFNGIALKSLEDSSMGVELEMEAGWSIRVPRVLVAVNGFAKTLLPDIAVSPARNQVLITKAVPKLAVKGCFHYDRGFYYFRNIDGRILLGGGRNLDNSTEQTELFGPNTLIRNKLENLLETTICPGQAVEIDTWWTGILGLGPIKKPIVESYSQNIVVAVRLGGMGVAIGTLIGQEGAEMLLNA